MPAPVLTPSKVHNKAVVSKPTSQSRSTKTRIVRRRGRARATIDSDDELEREARSDSGSDDDKSSVDSDSDDDSVHSEDVLRNGHSAAVTPSTTQSPQLDDKPLPIDCDPSNNHSRLNGNVSGPFETVTKDWSEMVPDDNAWATLPIVDFDKLDAVAEQQLKPSTGRRTRKSRKGDKKSKNRENTGLPQDRQYSENEQPDDEPVASTSRRGNSFPPRGGRSAREAYQTRLRADPSYVPTVGEFWGHDDRLLDKELRSLSGWWRGRWQGTGRGRGGFANRGRGGGFFTGSNNLEQHERTEGDPIPPIERPWGHDGFEEMKRREEQRRQQAQRQELNSRSVPLQRGIGGFRGGRGGFFPTRGRSFSRGSFITHSPRSSSTHSDRPWFAMKPERMWTKQLDWFLHSDPSLKPRSGQGQGFRVKLAGTEKEHVVRTPSRRYSFPQLTNPATTTQSDVVQHENEDKPFIVRIPTRTGKETASNNTQLPPLPESTTVSLSDPTTVETEESLEEVFTVKPRTVPSASISVSLAPRDSIPTPIAFSSQQSSAVGVANSQARTELVERAVVKSPPPQLAVDSGGDSVLNPKSPPKVEARPSPPVLPPIQTVFSPVAPQPQDFNAPYSYGPALPPGVVLNAQGMAYEIATGRPVYLQPTPPPLYDPRPIMPAHMPLHAGGVPFVPGHMHHHSNASPDFLASHSHPRTPPMTGFIDPLTGMPIFSLPRQNSRIEIRRPTDAVHHPASKPSPGHAHRPSGLRTTVSALEAAAAQEEEEAQHSRSPDYYPSITDHPPTHSETNGEERIAGSHHPGMDPTVIAYQPYQPYFYPEYGYPYVDASQMHYDMYQDHHNTQPTIYY